MKLLVVFVLLLTPTLEASCGSWKMTTTRSPYADFNSIKLTYCPAVKINGMIPELVISASGYKFILNLLWCPLFADASDRYTAVTFTSEGYPPVHFYPYRYLGDQKLAFNESDTKEIIQQLLNGTTFTLSVGMYHTQIDDTDFTLRFSRAQNLLRKGVVEFNES